MDKKSNCIALFLSVLLHSLLVFFPWKENQQTVADSSPPVNSIPVIVDVSQLPTIPASEAEPRPPAPSVLSSSPPTAAPLSPPVAPPVDSPADLPPEAPIAETSDSPVHESASDVDPDSDDAPATTPSTAPSTPNSVTPTDEAKIAADWEHLVGHLEDQDEGFVDTPLREIFDLFGESEEQVNQFFDENGQPRLDVSSFYLFPEQTPEQVLQTVVIPELTSNTDFELQPQENVLAGLAYQLLQGEMRRYLIIVQLNERSGSVLMLSDSLRGLES